MVERLSTIDKIREREEKKKKKSYTATSLK
jgi:hypothetical protein